VFRKPLQPKHKKATSSQEIPASSAVDETMQPSLNFDMDCEMTVSNAMGEAAAANDNPNPIKQHDASTQWEDPSLIDHQYMQQISLRGNTGSDIAVSPSTTYMSCSMLCDKECKFFTGLSLSVFHSLVSSMAPFAKPRMSVTSRRGLDVSDQLLLVLMKLRLGVLHMDLAHRFGISCSSVSNMFAFWIPVMADKLKDAVIWLSRDTIRATMPTSFRKLYPRTTCIIDCSEIFIQRPHSLYSRATTYSNYKSHNTAKFLIGIAPTGSIMFVSNSYGGRASDRYIVNDSGFLKYLMPGDEVMADRGFTIETDLLPYGVSLNMPAFRRGLKQLSNSEVVRTRRIASVRIHVERMIARLKNFRILKFVLPITLVPQLDNILIICCALCNFQSDVIKQEAQQQ
jgi:DDE superfamily endonuclease/Helix-turn-helix of DDE superfamily endonuclease